MNNGVNVLVIGGVFFLFLGTLTGWWLISDMKNNEGNGNRYVWASHKAALWFGFMSLGFAYVTSLINISPSFSLILAYCYLTSLFLILTGQIILGVKKNPNSWINPAPAAIIIIGSGNFVLTIAVGVYLFKTIGALA